MSFKNKINTYNSHKNYGKKATLAQVLATMAQSFLLIGLGMELAMPTIVIQYLYQNSKSDFSLTLNEVSWYGSVLLIFHPTGSFLSGFLQERFGRKRCMIFANIPSIFGWILLYFAQSTISLYTSTVLMGLSIGFSEAPIISYVGEITEPRLRGSLASIATTAAILGSLLIFILGFFYDWRTVALLSTLCPIICICVITFIPESPMWLVAKGKNGKAEKALCWLRGWVDTETIKAEHLELINYTEVSGIRGDKFVTDNGFFSKLAGFKDPSVYKPVKLVLIFFFFSIISSLYPCKPFFVKIMIEAGILNNQSLLLVSFAVLQIIGCLIVIVSVNSLGKRFMALLSFSVNAIFILLFGVYIIAMKNNYIISTPWIPITIICSISFFGAPVISLPWMLISEVFQNKIRGLASGSCAGMNYLMMFVLTKSYLSVENILTLEYTMMVFGIIGIFGVIFLYFYLPETENKTLLEIEEFFT